MTTKKTIGLALSGGGVKGLGHIGLLKKLDQLQLKPDYISGTSMGAILGALYASGMTGAEIEARVRDHIVLKGTKAKQIYKNRKNLIKWAKVFSFEKQRGGFFAADGLFEHLFQEIVDLEFSDLSVPFCAIATDYHSGEEVCLSEGNVLAAVKASMAIPAVFAPQHLNGKTLVDGGLVNNLPVKHVQHCDLKIASNVIALPKKETPKAMSLLTGSLSIMIRQATRLQLDRFPCDYLHEVDTDGIDTFDFFKINTCLKVGDKAASELDKTLNALALKTLN